MENMRYETRPCAHCGGAIARDDTTCATCGEAYIPDTTRQAAAPPPPAPDGSADGAALPPRGSFDGSAQQRTPPPGYDQTSDSSLQPRSAPVTDESRMWAMGSHLSALAGALLGGLPAFLGPLVIWLIRREDQDPFAAFHAREALNFNLSVIIYAIAAVVLTVVTLGLGLLLVIPVGIAAFVGYVVVSIRATMAASRSDYYRYPLTIRLVQ